MANALVGSLFVYKMQMLPKVSSVLVKKVNSMFKDFIWHGGKPKLKMQMIQVK